MAEGENLDISSDPCSAGRRRTAAGRRPFVGIRFACCDLYVRVYVNRNGTAYESNCPGCGRPVRIRIGPQGTTGRFFTAY
jgi:hypothetical protein